MLYRSGLRSDVDEQHKERTPFADEVHAEVVNISQGGAAHIEANRVSIKQGGAQAISATKVEIEHGGAAVVSAEQARVTSSAVGLLVAEEAIVESSTPAIAVTSTLTASNTRIGVLLAGRVEGKFGTNAVLGTGFSWLWR